jgi:hypothetical protein
MGRRWLVCVLLVVATGWVERASAQTLTIAWDPSPDPSVVGYIVYAGVQSGEYFAEFNVGAATSFVYGIVPETPHFFAVASYNDALLVGPRSTEIVGTAHATAVLADPGDQWASVGSVAELQLFGADSAGGIVTYSAANLPPGIDIDNSTGLASGTPTSEGSYVVTATASNGVSTVSQTFTWTIGARAADVTPPVVSITMPAAAARLLTADPVIFVGGTATDDDGVVAVTWVTSRGVSGAASGTDVWLAGIHLQAGRNEITITAVDPSGNSGHATISIYRQTSSQ